jgi:hypothetical protein
MAMNLKELQKPLLAHEIEFRVQSINKGGFATILAYKDARVDMQRLDDVCGPLGWRRRHVNANHNCIVSIFNQDTKEWVDKEDTGTESNTEAAKGLASDSFKRACFNWGIGRELYDYPSMSVKLIGDGSPLARGDKQTEWFINDKKKDKWGNPKPDQTWNLKIKEWQWFTQFDGGKLSYICAQSWGDNCWIKRFEWGHYNETTGEENA